MTMNVSRLAILMCWTVTSAVVVGQNNSSPPLTDTQGAAVYSAAGDKETHSQDATGSDCTKKKNKEKNKHETKPTPSKQDQEFERVLQGIYG